ncbi:hypothetical protein [[Limnothrix rosea] IAM M-220]|uniref:hypothetical protein n=1 Tax=[Limnothrix rosea] IAM M-220 TaxID=454133 RepID=UPI000964BC94|nr:hypothetical protein [[Limnothrix rosea] IAM M-220]OKH18572.1 hypothetical protein NIES208_05015 [[Limnothrix rosea] IAM M-220]
MTNASEVLFAHDPKYHTGEKQESETVPSPTKNTQEQPSDPTPTSESTEEVVAPVETTTTVTTSEAFITLEQVVSVTSFSALFVVPICFWLLRQRR